MEIVIITIEVPAAAADIMVVAALTMECLEEAVVVMQYQRQVSWHILKVSKQEMAQLQLPTLHAFLQLELLLQYPLIQFQPLL